MIVNYCINLNPKENMNNTSLLSALKNLSIHVTTRRKIQFFFLLILTIFSGIIEILSIASVVPFVSLITDGIFIKEKFYL